MERIDGVLEAGLEALKHFVPGGAAGRGDGGLAEGLQRCRRDRERGRGGNEAGLVAGHRQAAADAVVDMLGGRGAVERDHRQAGSERFHTFISGRATRNMDRLGIRREGDQVTVDLSRMFKSDADAAGWAAAVVKL